MNRTSLITLGLSLAACSSSPTQSTTSAPTTADYDDAAQTIAASTVTGTGNGAGGGGNSDTGDLSFGDVLVFRDAVSLAHGRLPLGFLRDTNGHCHGNRMGVSQDFTITCKDAAGAALAKCDSTTDSATVTVMSKGDIQTPNLTSSVDREANFTITGLQSATAQFDGDSSFSLDTSLTSVFHQGAMSTLTFDATASYKAITITTADRQVTGGTANFEVKAHRTVTGTGSGSGSDNHDVDKSFDVTAALTFNADKTATLVLDGMHTFTIDLTTGKVTKVN
jgi:hypothetical protein